MTRPVVVPSTRQPRAHASTIPKLRVRLVDAPGQKTPRWLSRERSGKLKPRAKKTRLSQRSWLAARADSSGLKPGAIQSVSNGAARTRIRQTVLVAISANRASSARTRSNSASPVRRAATSSGRVTPTKAGASVCPSMFGSPKATRNNSRSRCVPNVEPSRTSRAKVARMPKPSRSGAAARCQVTRLRAFLLCRMIFFCGLLSQHCPGRYASQFS